MKHEEYIQNILKKFRRHFDIHESYIIGDYEFDFLAEFHERNEKYFASKKITLDAAENNEYCFFKYLENMNKEYFFILSHILEEAISFLVKPTFEHMSTILTCVIISDKIANDGVIQNIEKYRFNKSFFLNLKGWIKIRFVLVDLTLEKIYTSKEGGQIEEVYKF